MSYQLQRFMHIFVLARTQTIEDTEVSMQTPIILAFASLSDVTESFVCVFFFLNAFIDRVNLTLLNYKRILTLCARKSNEKKLKLHQFEIYGQLELLHMALLASSSMKKILNCIK